MKGVHVAGGMWEPQNAFLTPPMFPDIFILIMVDKVTVHVQEISLVVLSLGIRLQTTISREHRVLH